MVYLDKHGKWMLANNPGSQLAGATILDQIQRLAEDKDVREQAFATWHNANAEETGEILSIQELWNDAGVIAHSLLHQWGATKADKAILCYETGPAFLAAFVGCLRAGVVAVVLPPPTTPATSTRLARVIQECESKVFLTDSTTKPLVSSMVTREEKKDEVEGSSLGNVPVVDTSNRKHDITISSANINHVCSEEDIAFIQYTSGSTSDPKGVVVSHKALAANIQLIHWRFRAYFDSQDWESVPMIGCSWLPHYHDLGLVWSLLAPLCGGWPIHLMSTTNFLANPLAWMKVVSDRRCSFGAAPDFAYRLLAKQKTTQVATTSVSSSLDLSCMRVFLNGAEPIQADTKTIFESAFADCNLPSTKSWMAPSYGLAEHVVAVCGINEWIVANNSTGNASVAVGDRQFFPPGLEIVVVDAETRQPLQDGQSGEVWICGPSVASGYYSGRHHNQQDTLSVDTFQAVLAVDGSEDKQSSNAKSFLRTGDLGFFQDDRLYICGRLKDVIIVNGVNYYPQDAEAAACRVAPDEVRPGGVVAFAQDGEGEHLTGETFVILVEIRKHTKKDSAFLMSLLQRIHAAISKATGLAASRICLVNEKTIPKTSSGKLQRAKSREMFGKGEMDILSDFKPLSTTMEVKKIPVDPGFDSHAVVVGAGIVGLCFARDLASLGYQVIVVEKAPQVGGVWYKNNYPGLKLHSPGFAYRCLSVAPKWTKEHTAEEFYRPNRDEILEYCQELVVHPNIKLLLNTECEYDDRAETEDYAVIKIGSKEVKTKYLLIATASSPIHTGEPVIPAAFQNQSLPTSNILHSSHLDESTMAEIKKRKGKIVIVGAGKAAIDLLQLFPRGDESIIWAHRGHRYFYDRAVLEDAYLDNGQRLAEISTTSRTAMNEDVREWLHAAFKNELLISCNGPISNAPMPFGLGSCSRQELRHAESFKDISLASLALNADGDTELQRKEDDLPLVLSKSDTLVLCTGQCNTNWNPPIFTKSVGFGTICSSITPVSSLVPLKFALYQLRGQSSVSSRMLHLVNAAVRIGLTFKVDDVHSKFVYLSACLIVASKEILCGTGPVQEVSFRQEWKTDWHGKDMCVDTALGLLEPGANNGDTQLEKLASTMKHEDAKISSERLSSMILHAREFLAAAAEEEANATTNSTLSLEDYTKFHKMLCSPRVASAAARSFSGTVMFLPHDYPRDEAKMPSYDKHGFSTATYLLLAHFSFTALATLTSQTHTLVAREETDTPHTLQAENDSSLVVDTCVTDYIKRKAGSIGLRLVRRFEFEFHGFANVSALMMHLESDDGSLHLVEVVRHLKEHEGDAKVKAERSLEEWLVPPEGRNWFDADQTASQIPIEATSFYNHLCVALNVSTDDLPLDVFASPGDAAIEFGAKATDDASVDADEVASTLAIVRETLAHALGVAVEEVDVQTPLIELGFDSILAVQAFALLNLRLGTDMKPESFLQLNASETVNSLATYIYKSFLRPKLPNDPKTGDASDGFVSLARFVGKHATREQLKRMDIPDLDRTIVESLLLPAPQSSLRWFSSRNRTKDAEDSVLLFCIHGMIGSASFSFGNFQEFLPSKLCPMVMCYPGDEHRSGESFPTNANELVEDICDAIVQISAGRRFGLLGYSMGGQLAVLVAHRMAKVLGKPPIVTISLCSTPHTYDAARQWFPMISSFEKGKKHIEYLAIRSMPLQLSIREESTLLWGDDCPANYEIGPLRVFGGKKDTIVPHRVLKKYWSSTRKGDNTHSFGFHLFSGADHFMPEPPMIFERNKQEAFEDCWMRVSHELSDILGIPRVTTKPPSGGLRSKSLLSPKDDLLFMDSNERLIYPWQIRLTSNFEGHFPVEDATKRAEQVLLSNPKWIRFRSKADFANGRWVPITDWKASDHLFSPDKDPTTLNFASKPWYFCVRHPDNGEEVTTTTLDFYFSHALGDGVTIRTLFVTLMEVDQAERAKFHVPTRLPLGTNLVRKYHNRVLRRFHRKHPPPYAPIYQKLHELSLPSMVVPMEIPICLSVRQTKDFARKSLDKAKHATVNDVFLMLVSETKRRVGEPHRWLPCTFVQRGLEEIDLMANASGLIPIHVGDGSLESIQKYTKWVKYSDMVTYPAYLEAGTSLTSSGDIYGLSNAIGMVLQADFRGHRHLGSQVYVTQPGLFFFHSTLDSVSIVFTVKKDRQDRGRLIRDTFCQVVSEHGLVAENA